MSFDDYIDYVAALEDYHESIGHRCAACGDFYAYDAGGPGYPAAWAPRCPCTDCAACGVLTQDEHLDHGVCVKCRAKMGRDALTGTLLVAARALLALRAGTQTGSVGVLVGPPASRFESLTAEAR